jgi:tetratricopeptide (TPR) repeat protein
LGRIEEMNKTLFLVGRALSIGKNLSFHPLIDILKSWARFKDDDTQAIQSHKLEKIIRDVDPEGAGEIFPFIATMIGIQLQGKHAERVMGIEGEALEKLILKNLRQLLVKAADIRPVVFAVEDLHWSDRTTLELLESLCRIAENTRILFINVFRPNYPETSERFLEMIRNRYPGLHSEIVLEPLNDRECQTLIENLLNIKGLPVHIRQLIAQKAEGNPFFIEEVARSFIDEGVVEMEDGQFQVTERINSVIIPETIHEILMARIDKLEEDTKSLLKIASVIGRNFFYKILVKVAATIKEIDDKLEFLKEVQLIKERKRLDEREYLFQHALIQEVAYESLLMKKRKELHLKVAEAIESVFSDRLHEFFGMLAVHYSSGENLEKAEEYLVKAGQEALKAAASSEAIHYYQEALRLYLAKHGDAGDPETIANLEWNIAKASLNKGHMIEAVAHFDRVLELWGDRRPKSKSAAALQFIISLLKVLRSLYLPTRKIKQIPTKRMNNIFEATYQRGTALVSVDTSRMVMDSIRFLGTIRKYDLDRVINGIPIYASSSALFFFSGISFRIARKLLDYAKSHIRPEDVKTLLTFKFWELAMDTLWGNWGKELGYDGDIVDRNIQDGDLFTAPGLVFWSGLLVTEQGRFRETMTYLKKLGEIGDVYENDYARSRRAALNIRYLLESRRLMEVLPEADQGISWLNKIGQKFWALYLLGLKAKALVIMGDLPGAEKALAQGEDSISDEKSIAPFYLSTFCLGRFLVDLDRLQDALRSDDKSRLARCRKRAHKSGKAALKNSMKCAPDQTETFRFMGVYCWLERRQKRALAWWARSIKVGEQLGARPELARTFMEIGGRLLEKDSRFCKLDGIPAEEYIKKAKILFEDMALVWDMEELEKINSYFA